MPRGTPSTQINITLGAEGLSEKAAMLQSAARQAQIEKERTQRIAAEGTEKREASQAAKGLAADGSSLYSNSPNVPQIERRPAAYRIGGEVFGYFYYGYTSVNGVLAIFVRSGDKSQTATATFPQIEDFPDLLLPYPEGEMVSPVYDQKGRLRASLGDGSDTSYPSTRAVSIFWPSQAQYQATEAQDVIDYQLSAYYGENSGADLFAFPAGKDNALVVVRLWNIKYASARTVRRDVRVALSYDGVGNVRGKCMYWTSPASYKNIQQQKRSDEQFAAFIVGPKNVRSLGSAPEAFINKIKATPMYKGFEDANMTNFLASVSDYNNVLAFQTEPGTCTSGGTSTAANQTWTRLYSFSTPIQRSQQRYKGIYNPGNTTIFWTPSAFTVINNYNSFVTLAPNPMTDTFMQANLPAKAAQIKWRSFDTETKIPYEYTGTPPVSWTGDAGPSTINEYFPTDWKKSGKKPSITITQNDYPYVVWDWGDPPYCRQQLLAFGFTSADLTP